ncbi:MAG: glycosyltransferase family 4 protein [Sulfurovum sp.]|nr:glycosyltransferase family 4 protein [Sulfurovum sp.]MDD3499214.1 glycosyltransferase family 4 protein [Sulfurovum sp.]
MKKVSILIPVQEYLNSYRGGAIARWISHVYKGGKHDYQFDILGRTLNDEYDFRNTDSLTIVSKYNNLLNVLTGLPIIRTIFKPFISSIYLKIYRKDIRSSEILEVHNSIEYIAKIRKLNFSGKIILHMHNNYLNKLSKEFIHTLNSQINLLIFPSKALKNEFLAMHPEFNKPIEVVYNGYDPKKFFPQKEGIPKANPVIGYIGRFDKNKNILNLLDIYSALLDKIPNLEFYLIGSGKSGGVENKYQRLVLKKIEKINRQNGKITYLGYVHNDQLYKYYNLFDLFISLPVHTEAFGMTFVEALACKTLSIGTNLGGIPEAIGCNELLINNPKDHMEVVDKMIKILSDETLYQSLVEKTFNYVSMNFQWKAIQTKQLKVLAQVS